MNFYAEDADGNEAKTSAKLIINRYGANDLFIEPVPNFSIVEGQKGLPSDIIVTVLSKLPMAPKLDITDFKYSSSSNSLNPPLSLERVVDIIHLGSNNISTWPEGMYVHKWRLVNSYSKAMIKWGGKETKSDAIISLTASQGGAKASTSFRMQILRSKQFNGKADNYFIFKLNPSSPQHIIDGNIINPVKISGEINENIDFPVFPYYYTIKLVGASSINGYLKLSNLRNYPKIEGIINGDVIVGRWGEGETRRTLNIGVSGEPYSSDDKYPYSGEKSANTAFFPLTIDREYADYDRNIIPIPDQEVRDGSYINPFKFQAEAGPRPLTVISVNGCPPGVHVGGGGFYEGCVKIPDWAKDETERVYTVSAKVEIQANPNEGNNFKNIKEISFKITVKRFITSPETAKDPSSSGSLGEKRSDTKESDANTPQEGESSLFVLPGGNLGTLIGSSPTEGEGEKPAISEDKDDKPTTTEDKVDKPDTSEYKVDKPAAAEDKVDKPSTADYKVDKPDTSDVFLPVNIEDFSEKSTKYTNEQKSLPRLGIAILDDTQNAFDVYDGIISGLIENGFIPNKDVIIVVTNAEGSPKKDVEHLEMLEKMKCTAIVAIDNPISKLATRTIRKTPIVMAGVNDPRASGYVDRNGKAKGKYTGVTNSDTMEKLIDLIKKMQTKTEQGGLLFILNEDAVKERKELFKNNGIKIKKGSMYFDSSLEYVSKELLNQELDFIILDPSASPLENQEILENLVKNAMELGIAVYGTEVEQLNAGCAAICIQDYKTIGYLSGVLSSKVLKGENIKNLAFVENPECIIGYNSATVEALGLWRPKLIYDEKGIYLEK